MNKKFIVPVIFFLSFNFLGLQPKNSSDLVLQTAVRLFKYVTIKEYGKAADLIAYKGSNSKRYLKTGYNYANKNEKKIVERICKRIYKYFRISDSFKILKSRTKNLKKSVKEIFVEFKSGKQKLEIGFKFIKAGNKYLLTDID